ncbi:MAG: 6-phosphofructokinase [Deltaproteobacteria bacterium]|nr:6-phosphofructokinase [Deltaproteobacteria bacterium]
MKRAKIGILTGGGDCPGLNATIRSVTKSADVEGIEVFGISQGFLGLYENQISRISLREVSGVLPQGGTILGSSRFNPFKRDEILEVCLDHYKKAGLDGLVVIGGDGTLGIANDLWQKHQLPVIGIPKTIDNDVYGTDRTIGFYTAVQTCVDAIDKLHTTAESHNFIMVVELMGRHCGFLAAYAGMAGGADFILIPEVEVTVNQMVGSLKERHGRGKNFSIVVVAEDAKLYDDKGQEVVSTPTYKDEYGKIKLGGVGQLVADVIKNELGYETRYTNLGHVQRGGSPVAIDRLLATSFGCAAIELVQKNVWGALLAYEKGGVVAKHISVVRDGKKTLPVGYYKMAQRFFR